MFRVRRVGALSVFASVLLVAAFAVPSTAAPLSFGAKLSHQTEPQDSTSCHSKDPNDIPKGGVCTWIAAAAFENGSHYTAPANGTLTKLRLMSCDSGKFTLQLVKRNSHGNWKVVTTGPQISYKADPRQAQNNCGDQNGDTLDYLIQTFNIHVSVQKGEYIAVKAAKLGVLGPCSGDEMPIIYPVLSTGQGYRHNISGAGCPLLVSLQY